MRNVVIRTACAAGLALLAVTTALTLQSDNHDPGVLWRFVHDVCPKNGQNSANPFPCLILKGQGEGGYAILKDKIGESQFLLIPTVRLSGIDDPKILSTETPNYFAEAWRARLLVSGMRERELPRSSLSLAINSKDNRDQDQLHIHIDCVRQDILPVLHKLKLTSSSKTRHWQTVRLNGREYRLVWVPGKNLSVNPFKLLSATVPPSEMGHYSLAVIGTKRPGIGFFILDTSGNGAHAEDLQSHDACPE